MNTTVAPTFSVRVIGLTITIGVDAEKEENGDVVFECMNVITVEQEKSVNEGDLGDMAMREIDPK